MNLKLASIELQNKVISSFNNFVSAQFRLLIETKHLYQRLSFQPDRGTLLAGIGMGSDDGYSDRLSKAIDEISRYLLCEPLPIAGQRIVSSAPVPVPTPIPSSIPQGITVGNVKLFCRSCKGPQAFSPLSLLDVTKDRKFVRTSTPSQDSLTENSPCLQIFSLLYQCQLCGGQPEAFLVRREGWNLSVQGRSPMEHIEIPAHIPKVEAKFFRDALIAMNAGKPLAGLFYLRTFIEQFARRQTGKLTERATGDEIMDAYGALLPDRQRDQMPSLKYCYAKLSEPIHAARDDESVFKDVLDQIEHHFDVRRVFKIPDASRSIK